MLSSHRPDRLPPGLTVSAPEVGLGFGFRGGFALQWQKVQNMLPYLPLLRPPAEQGKDSSLGGWVHRMNTCLGQEGFLGATWSLSRPVQALRLPPRRALFFPWPLLTGASCASRRPFCQEPRLRWGALLDLKGQRSGNLQSDTRVLIWPGLAEGTWSGCLCLSFPVCTMGTQS